STPLKAGLHSSDPTRPNTKVIQYLLIIVRRSRGGWTFSDCVQIVMERRTNKRGYVSKTRVAALGYPGDTRVQGPTNLKDVRKRPIRLSPFRYCRDMLQTNAYGSKTAKTLLTTLVVFSIFATSLASTIPSAAQHDDIDTSVRPGDDFYRFANG